MIMRDKDTNDVIFELQGRMVELEQKHQIIEQRLEELFSNPNKPYTELYSMADAVFAIDGLNPSNTADKDLIYDVSYHVGKNLDNWDYDFVEAKIELVAAARKAGFTNDCLPAIIDNCLIEGQSHFNEENES